MKKLILRVLGLLIVLLIVLGFAIKKAQASGCAFLNRDYCVPGYISSETWWTPTPEHAVGKAVWYAPYLMERTAEFRGMSLDGFVGGVAMMSPADMGQVVWLLRPDQDGQGDTEWEGPFLVVDTSARQDMWVTITKLEEVVEVDFETALRWGMVSGSKENYTINEWMIRDVEVWKGLHPPWEKSEPINYRTWFEQTLTWGDGTYRRWSMDDIEIANYDVYQHELATLLKIDLSKLVYSNVETADMIEVDMVETETTVDEITSINGVLIEEEVSDISYPSVYQAHNYTQAYLETVEAVNEITWNIDCTDNNPYNGFIFYDWCVPGVITKASWMTRYPQYTVGVATYYQPGIMQTVVENRGMSLSGYVDGIVLMTCAHVGESVWVRRGSLGWEGPYLVVDCGQPDGTWGYSQYRLHVEVDYNRWVQWRDTTGTGRIELCIGSSNCSGSPATWYGWFLATVEWLVPIISE